MGHNLKLIKMEIPEAIKLIQEMKSWMPSDNKNFDKEREAIDRVLQEFEKECDHPYAFVVGGGLKPEKCLKCGKILSD